MYTKGGCLLRDLYNVRLCGYRFAIREFDEVSPDIKIDGYPVHALYAYQSESKRWVCLCVFSGRGVYNHVPFNKFFETYEGLDDEQISVYTKSPTFTSMTTLYFCRGSASPLPTTWKTAQGGWVYKLNQIDKDWSVEELMDMCGVDITPTITQQATYKRLILDRLSYNFECAWGEVKNKTLYFNYSCELGGSYRGEPMRFGEFLDFLKYITGGWETNAYPKPTKGRTITSVDIYDN